MCAATTAFRRQRSLLSTGLVLAAALLLQATGPREVHGQLPSALYTWDAPANVQEWVRAFGANTATLESSTAGELTIVETGTPGESIAISDGSNRVRESSTASNGGTDLTGLDWLEFDLGHTGAGPINVQFYIQGSLAYTYRALGPDVPVQPGMNTYRVPLTGLTFEEQVYIRQLGFNARPHTALGNVTWTLQEVRSGGTPLTERDLITHDLGSAEGGLQGAIGNFDLAAIMGNDGGQNQSGLSHNPAGDGSLRWVDLGGGPGAAITWGNGTAWSGNAFNTRTTDLSGYTEMIVRMSAHDPLNGGGQLGVQGFFQKNGFQFQAAQGGAQLPIDGQFHDLKFSLDGLPNMNVVEFTGLNLGSHTNDLTIDVDRIRFRKVDFAEHTLFSWENGLEGWTQGPEPGHVHSIVAKGATHGATALQIDRSSVRGNGATVETDAFVPGSVFTTTEQAVIDDLVPRINNAARIAFDVSYEEQFPAAPTFTNFYVAISDGVAIYRADTAGINLNNTGGVLKTDALQIPIESFVDTVEGSTKRLSVEGLSPTATTLSIALISNTDYGAVYQIDNFRLITEVPPLRADFNGDQLVNDDDLQMWEAAYGGGPGADADADGDTDGADFLIWQREYSAPSTSSIAAAVPEPASWLLAGIVAAAGVRRRRKGSR